MENRPACVEAIISEVIIGQDLSLEERLKVQDLISEFADCFTLSMSEVTPVNGVEHRLDNSVIDKMLAVGIIQPIAHQDIKCCGATTLAKKTHEGDRLTLNILKHHINNQCIAIGFPPAFEELPPINEVDRDSAPPIVQNKWQVCQDFNELNQVTKVPPMPQGDIR